METLITKKKEKKKKEQPFIGSDFWSSGTVEPCIQCKAASLQLKS